MLIATHRRLEIIGATVVVITFCHPCFPKLRLKGDRDFGRSPRLFPQSDGRLKICGAIAARIDIGEEGPGKRKLRARLCLGPWTYIISLVGAHVPRVATLRKAPG